MDPRTLKEVMGQGATRPETPHERREREQLEADLESSPVRGVPLRRRLRNFPVEARLAMDPRTRDFVRINGRSYLREPLDARWILDRFPADRNAALAG